jgi:single-strand DNA-binding protein
MRSLNKVNLIGNLGQDPELKYTKNGDAVISFSLATSEAWKDKNTGELQEATEWHRCVAYRQTAEILAKYLNKGSKLYVDGKLKTRKWTDEKTGQERFMTEIAINDFLFLSPKSGESDGNSAGNSAGRRPGKPPQYGGSPPADDGFEEDIPF